MCPLPLLVLNKEVILMFYDVALLHVQRPRDKLVLRERGHFDLRFLGNRLTIPLDERLLPRGLGS